MEPFQRQRYGPITSVFTQYTTHCTKFEVNRSKIDHFAKLAIHKII